jgi:N-acetylmuramoyl-L-alanine amidase
MAARRIKPTVSLGALHLNTRSTDEGNVVLKKSKAAFGAAVVALTLFGAPIAKADAWKMGALSHQVSLVQEAQDLQETDRRELVCMALAIYHEAKGQAEIGMEAIGHVILNRAKSLKFPTTVCGVVWQQSQFSWTSRPVMALVPRESDAWIQAQKVALEVLDPTSEDPTHGATHFYNKVTDHPRWLKRGTRTFAVGPHVFMKLS